MTEAAAAGRFPQPPAAGIKRIAPEPIPEDASSVEGGLQPVKVSLTYIGMTIKCLVADHLTGHQCKDLMMCQQMMDLANEVLESRYPKD